MKRTTLLALLQQSEYDLRDFSRWYRDHQTEDLTIDPDNWTPKLKLISTVSKGLFFLPELPQIIWATKLVSPIDGLIRLAYLVAAKSKLWLLRRMGLKVVAIAGSYGKTSTKSIMEHILSSQQKMLVTPKSINTLLGISQVILGDLKLSHQLFVVEFGEYNAQDVAHLTAFTQPDFAVLTPIGRQHLERFGSLDNIVKTFLPLILFFMNKPNSLLIASQNTAVLPPTLTANKTSKPMPEFPSYGDAISDSVALTEVSVSRRGTEFTLLANQQITPQRLFIPLYGKHQAINTLPSFWLATKLKLSIEKVASRAASLPYVERRHQPHFGENNVLVLDNSYNTNADSVAASLELLNQLDASRRFFLTAGFVELGEKSQAIHLTFGKQLAAKVDYVGLVETPWTDAIIEGFVSAGGKREHIFTGTDFDQILAKLSGMIIPGSILIFEGGYREVYA